jgi:hypothetical protein
MLSVCLIHKRLQQPKHNSCRDGNADDSCENLSLIKDGIVFCLETQQKGAVRGEVVHEQPKRLFVNLKEQQQRQKSQK